LALAERYPNAKRRDIRMVSLFEQQTNQILSERAARVNSLARLWFCPVRAGMI
jgi:hypothetical protein